jgi:hypothetical protein
VVGLDGFATGIRRFVIGLGKKMLIANIVAGPADRLFALPPGELTAAHAWLARCATRCRSTSTSPATRTWRSAWRSCSGSGFKENFNYPYVSQSIQEFWRRWHISLSAWFRDYLYVPLGGNRVAPGACYLNLVTVFFLCGLWHGASWTFVVWGLYHGAFLVLERLGLAAWLGRMPRALRHVYALLVVMVGWVFFRAESLSAAAGLLQAMAGFSPADPTAYGVDVVPDARAAARDGRGHRRLGTGVAGACGPLGPAVAGRPRPRTAGVGADVRGAGRHLRGLRDADRGPHLQPVHLLPLLMPLRLHRRGPPPLVIAFLAALVTPGVVMLARLDSELPRAENASWRRRPHGRRAGPRCGRFRRRHRTTSRITSGFARGWSGGRPSCACERCVCRRRPT